MKTFWLNNKFALLSALCVLAFLFIFFSDVLLSPNSFLFSPGGDGLKNYYTYLFHAKHDEGFWEFNGMNYPFGENIVYTDAHPLLSYIIGGLGLTNYGIGILNLAMLLSFPLCAFILYKILVHYKLPILWSLTASTVIAILSPQIYRIGGHLSLSYAFAIPAVWWLLILIRKDKAWLWSIILALFISVFFYTHPYLGMIMMAFIAAFWLVVLLTEKQKWKTLLLVVIQLVLPFVLFRVLISLNDTHYNRIGEPAGFFNYYASWKSFFIPFFGPLDFIKNVFGINVGNWESWNYIGLSTILFLILIGYFLLQNFKYLNPRAFLKTDLAKFIIAGILVLLFAFCFPMKFWWAKWLTEYFGALKQFRVLGRFGWVFYYVLTVSSAILIYRIYNLKKHRIYPFIFFGAMLFTLVEGGFIHNEISKTIPASENLFQSDHLEADMKDLIQFTKSGEYDAILFLPFTHMSSENIMLLGTEEASKDAFLLSYHTGLPLMNSVSSRMSMDESKLFNNFFGPEYIYKDLVDFIPPTAKILLVKNEENALKREMPLIWTQRKIYENNTYKAFTFDLKKYNDRQYNDEVWSKSESLSDSLVYLKDFEENKDYSFIGEGALKGVKNSWFVYDTLSKNELPTGDYTASLWYYIGVNRPDMVANCEWIYPDSNVVAAEFDIKQSTHIYQDWCFIQLNFTFKEEVEQMRFSIIGNDSQEPFYLDAFQIQPANTTYIKREKRGDTELLIYNNMRIPRWPISETEL